MVMRNVLEMSPNARVNGHIRKQHFFRLRQNEPKKSCHNYVTYNNIGRWSHVILIFFEFFEYFKIGQT